MTITNGLSTRGGGISGNHSYAQVKNCFITGNKAYNDDYFAFGGGIYGLYGNITNCVISENEAYYHYQSGTAYGSGGAGLAWCRGDIKDCIISNNSALSNRPYSMDGGGLYVCSGIISRCIIMNNHTVGMGGGLVSCYGTIENCLIVNNSAKEGGGFSEYEGIISNCTIINNFATDEGGGARNKFREATIENCIFWGNVAGTHSQVLNLSLPRYSCIQDWTAGGIGNMNLDPLFTGDGYHITVNSPCLDAGDPNPVTEPNATDIDGDPRMIVRIDIGADEFFPLDSGWLHLQSKDYDFQVLGLDSNTLPQLLRIYNYGGLGFDWHIELPNACGWLNISKLSGHTASLQMNELSIDIDYNSIDYGFYNCQFQVFAPTAIGSPQTVSVNLNVLGPMIQVFPQSFLFERLSGDINIVEDVLYIDNAGYDTLNWQIEVPDDCNWLSVNPTRGQIMTDPNEVIIRANPEGLDLGIYNTQLKILALDASNSPQIIPVTLHIHRPGERHVPHEYPTLQDAVYAADNNDVIILQPGIYELSNYVSIYSKSLTIRSVDPQNPAVVAATVINGYGLSFGYSGSDNSKIQGLTFEGKRARNFSNAIVSYRSNLAIENCIIKKHNVAISIMDSDDLVIRNCQILSCPPQMVEDSYYERGIKCDNSNLMLINSLITGSTGVSISCMRSNLDIINCTITDTKAIPINYHTTPIQVGIFCDYDSNINLLNSILWNNHYPDGNEIYIDGISNPSTVTLFYCDIHQGSNSVYVDPCSTLNWGDGNIDIDPCFANPGYLHDNDTPTDANDDFWVDGDYHLKSQAGRWEWSKYIGLDPTGDGFIDLVDYSAFASYWKSSRSPVYIPGTTIILYPYVPADLDDSGIVDLFDLRLLLDSYLTDYNIGKWVTDYVTSPCIDTADPNSDWTEELWPHGKRINMGAYGGTPEASMSLSEIGNIANLDNDLTDAIDFNDLGIIVNKWCEEEILLAEDLNRDNIINFVDYAIFAENWLQTGSP